MSHQISWRPIFLKCSSHFKHRLVLLFHWYELAPNLSFCKPISQLHLYWLFTVVLTGRVPGFECWSSWSWASDCREVTSPQRASISSSVNGCQSLFHRMARSIHSTNTKCSLCNRTWDAAVSKQAYCPPWSSVITLKRTWPGWARWVPQEDVRHPRHRWSSETAQGPKPSSVFSHVHTSCLRCCRALKKRNFFIALFANI